MFNIGSGQPQTINEVARQLAEVLNRRHLCAEITGKYRVGDIRHCFADISRARRVLGYEPMVSFNEGLPELSAWVEGQRAEDRVSEARAELDARGLAI